jgi:hypothetical protein
MNISTKEEAVIRKIVEEQCDSQAHRWKSYGDFAYDHVFDKVCENLLSVNQLRMPFEHFVRKTAWYEARRFFQKEKAAVRFCKPAAALENVYANSAPSVLETLVEAETHERLLKELSKLPRDQLDPLLVRAGAQALDPDLDPSLDPERTNQAKSIRELARRRSCSAQHLCNLANKGQQWLKKQLE